MTEQRVSQDGKPDVAVLRDEIKQTRAELGETMQALAAKADVKARAKESASRTATQLKQSAGETAERAKLAVRDAGESARRNPTPWLAVGGAVLGAAILVGALVILRRRR